MPWEIVHYKISKEKFEPDPGFEPRTSKFLAQRSTTWAILVLMPGHAQISLLRRMPLLPGGAVMTLSMYWPLANKFRLVNQIINWKQTRNLCLRKFTLSYLRRKIWIWTGIRNSELRISRPVLYHLSYPGSHASSCSNLPLETDATLTRFESRFWFKVFSWDLIM